MDNRYTAMEWAAMEGGNEVAPRPVAKFSFLDELTEAKMYRGRDTLSGKTADDLAKVAYLMIMMLEILRTEDKEFTKSYVRNTMWAENFTAMRSNASDLHNILAVLANQDKFQDKIKVNHNISVPVLQLRRYLRDIEGNRKELSLDRSLFKSLEGFLKISDSACKEVRRTVGDWHSAGDTEKSTIRHQIKNLLQPSNQQNDLLTQFRTHL
jgi:FAD/FMN-containing dehydrogenase